MRKKIRRSVALLLVLCMIVPMFSNIVFAVGEEATPDTVINFVSGDGNTYRNNGDPKLNAGHDFGAFTYLGGVNLGTTQVTAAQFQSNGFSEAKWVILRLDNLTSGKYDLTFACSRGDANVYLKSGSQVANAADFVATLNTESASYLGQLSVRKNYQVELSVDGDYLLILNGVGDANLLLQSLSMTRTGDADPVPVSINYAFNSGGEETYTSWESSDIKMESGKVFGNWAYLCTNSKTSVNSGVLTATFSAGSMTVIRLNNVIAGTYDLNFTVSTYASGGVIEALLLPGDVEGTTTAVTAALESAASAGTFDCFTGSVSTQTAGKITFEDSGSYTLVFKVKGSSPLNTGNPAYRMRVASLELEPAQADAATPSVKATSPVVPNPDPNPEPDTPTNVPEYVFDSGDGISYATNSSQDNTKLTSGKTFGNWTYLHSKSNTTVSTFINSNFGQGAWTAIRLNNVTAGTYDLSFKVSRNDGCGVIEVLLLPGDVAADDSSLTAALETAVSVGAFDNYTGADVTQTAGKVTFEDTGSYTLIFRSKESSSLNTGTAAFRMRVINLDLVSAEAEASTPSVKATSPVVSDPNPDDPAETPEYVFNSGNETTYYSHPADNQEKLTIGKIFGNWAYLNTSSKTSLTSGMLTSSFGKDAWTAIRLNNVTAGTYELAFGVAPYASGGVIEVLLLPGDVAGASAAITEALGKAAVSVGSFDCYTGAASKQIAGKITFADNGNYTLVLRAKDSSSLNTGTAAYRMRVGSLDLVPAEVTTGTPSVKATGGSGFGVTEAPDYAFVSGSTDSYQSFVEGDLKLTSGKTFGNWAYLYSTGKTTLSAAYLNSNIGQGGWTAVRLNNVTAGTYELAFGVSANVAGGVIEVLLLPGDVKGNVNAMNAGLDEMAVSIGSFDCYKGAAATQIAGKVTFENSGSYTLVMRSEKSSALNTTEDPAYRLRVVSLDLSAAAADAKTPIVKSTGGSKLGEAEAVKGDYVFSSGSEITYTTKGSVEEGNLLSNYMVMGNWTYMVASGNASIGPAATSCVWGSEGGYVVIRLHDVKAGTYKLTFTVGRNKGNGVSDVYILPVNNLYSPEYLAYNLPRMETVGSIDGYIKADIKQTLDKPVNFTTDGDYYLVLRAKAQSPLNPDATEDTSYYRGRIAALDLDPTTEKAGMTVTSQDPNNYFGKEELYDPIDVGMPLAGRFSVPAKTATAKVNGHDYYIVPIRGGMAYVFDLDTKEIVDTFPASSVPRGCVVDNQGKVYVAADRIIDIYDLHTKEHTEMRFPADITPATNAWDAVFVSELDCVFFASNPGVISCYNTLTGEWSTFGDNDCYKVDPVLNYIQSITYGDGYLYASLWGKIDNFCKSQIWKIDVRTGERVGYYDISGENKLNYDGTSLTSFFNLSYVNGKVFGGYSTLKNAFVLDAATMQLLDYGDVPGTTGNVTEVIDGKAYYLSAGARGMYQYDVEADTITVVPEFARASKAFRANVGNMVGSDADPAVGEKSLIVCTNKDGIWFYNLETGKIVKWSDILLNCGSGGTSIQTVQAGANSIWFGVYQDPQFGMYDINSGTWKVATNPAAQTDSIIQYGNKIYAGCYTTATLIEYDPVSGAMNTLVNLVDLIDQHRIHTLKIGDNKVFMGSLAAEVEDYGYLSWYDLVTGEVYTERLGAGTDSDLQYSLIIDMFYKDGLLYGATSTQLSNRLTSPAKQGHIFVYDVENRKLLGEFNVDIDGIGTPRWIASIEEDPYGNFWGMVDETLFTFEYDRATNTMTFEEKLTVMKDGNYVHRGGTGLFERPMIFADDGYLYVCFDETGGLRRINPDDPYNDNVLLLKDYFPRSYAIGSDGDLYYSAGNAIKKLDLNIQKSDKVVAKKVMNMINEIGEVTLNSLSLIFTAEEAYLMLTDAQKALVTNYDVLVAARERYDQLEQQEEAKGVVDRIAALGEITKMSRSKVAGIRRSYNALSDYAKTFVTNYDVLVAAEKALEQIKIAGTVDELIDAIGEVTLESEAAIQAARDAYEALTDEQKAYVEKLDVLKAAEAALKALKNPGLPGYAVALIVVGAALVAPASVVVFVPAIRLKAVAVFNKIFKR